MFSLDLIPTMYKNNPSARKIIQETFRKHEREGLSVGYWTEQASEMIGVQPADDRSGIDYGNEFELDIIN